MVVSDHLASPAGSEAPLPSLFSLRAILPAVSNDDVIRQISQQVKGSHHISIFFPQNNLIPSPKDLHFLALQSKLLRQPYRLTISRTKNPRCPDASTLRKCI
jgi:hypothetical protein